MDDDVNDDDYDGNVNDDDDDGDDADDDDEFFKCNKMFVVVKFFVFFLLGVTIISIIK